MLGEGVVREGDGSMPAELLAAALTELKAVKTKNGSVAKAIHLIGEARKRLSDGDLQS